MLSRVTKIAFFILLLVLTALPIWAQSPEPIKATPPPAALEPVTSPLESLAEIELLTTPITVNEKEEVKGPRVLGTVALKKSDIEQIKIVSPEYDRIVIDLMSKDRRRYRVVAENEAAANRILNRFRFNDPVILHTESTSHHNLYKVQWWE